MPKKTEAIITVGRIGIGTPTVRGAPQTVGFCVDADGRAYPKDTLRPWTVVPILVDGEEVIALQLDDARRFARALLDEVTR
jgi:hypothetical protein